MLLTLRPLPSIPLLPRPPHSSSSLFPQCIETLHGAGAATPEEHGRLTNTIRILTRLVPVIFEAGENSDFVDRFFWKNMIPAASSGAGRPSTAWEPLPTEGEEAPQPVGAALVHATMGALYVPEFTMAAEPVYAFGAKLAVSRARAEAREARAAARARGEPAAQSGEEGEGEEEEDDTDIIPDEANAVWPMLLWKGGVSFPRLATFPPTASQITARIDVLRLLIALCSQTLFAPPAPSSPARSRFLDAATGPTCPFAPTTFYCLFNTILAYDPVGMGVPYATAMLGDKEEPLVAVCLQTLLALLDYAPVTATPAKSPEAPAEPGLASPSAPEDGDADGAGAAPASSDEAAGSSSSVPTPGLPPPPNSQFNMYRSLASGISGAQDFDIIYGGITRLLAQIPAADQSLLPGAYTAPSCTQELLVLFWKLLDDNEEFLAHVLNQCDITGCVGPILYLMWNGRNNITKVGLIHLCTFILLLLSGERAFGVGLNRPFAAKLPAEMPLFEGTYADMLIIVLHKLVVDGSVKLSTLYSCFLTIICNASPYTKGLSLTSSVRLVNIFELFASPRFLFARPSNFAFAAQLLEVFNNMIQYQYESNAILVYSVVRRREVFERLASLSVAGWKAELSMKHAKKSAAAGAGAGAVGSAGADSLAARARGATAENAEWMERHAGEGAVGADAAPVAVGSSAPSASAGASGADGASAAPSAPWSATDEWFDDVRRQLPLVTVLRLVGYLGPLIEDHIAAMGGNLDDEAIVAFLRATTVVGILPVPHVIL